MKALFESIDANKDDKIDREELINWRNPEYPTNDN